MRRPPTAEATTGRRTRQASRATNPNDSDRLGTTTTSAARYQLESMVRLRVDELGAFGHAQGPDPLLHPPQLSRSVGSARSADDDEPGALVGEAGERLDRDGEALEGWMRPTNSMVGRSSRPRGGPGTGAVAREKKAWSTPEDQLDAVGPGAVELHQLVGLDRVGCADGVAAADHGGLGGFAGGRFVVAGGGP